MSRVSDPGASVGGASPAPEPEHEPERDAFDPEAHPGVFADGTTLLTPSVGRSSFAQTWTRRFVSISLYSLLFVFLWGLLPLFVIGGWIADRIRGKRVIVRASLFFAVYLLLEVYGVVLGFFMWIAGGTWYGRSPHRLLRWSFRLQCWWLRTIFDTGRWLYHWTVETSGDEAVTRGNILFFIRHVSTADTVLAAALVSSRHGVFLRYVLKSELLWDPCVDIFGNRLPNGFVDRGRGRTADAIAEVARLTENLGPMEGVLIYPEGTRFTPKKKARLLAKLEEREDFEKLEQARALQNVLPPKLAGPLALLENTETADVVFCVHTGFEKALGFHQFMAGALNDLHVRVHYWRVARAEIPESAADRVAWLHREWRRMDVWIAENTMVTGMDDRSRRSA